MSTPWNLTAADWSNVLLNEVKLETLASTLLKQRFLPWTDVLLKFTQPSGKVLDLGSGRGDHSAILALNGRRMTLLDWSEENIQFSAALFERMGAAAQFSRADMTKPLPFRSNSFDVVFSCGVFEYFTRDEIARILQEAFRVSRKRVIIMVPNALSIAYRVGKWYMEKAGTWHWGGEVPSYTLRHYFRNIPTVRVTEFSVAAKHSLSFLTMPFGDALSHLLTSTFRLSDHPNPSLFRQGYLLVTIAEKAGDSE